MIHSSASTIVNKSARVGVNANVLSVPDAPKPPLSGGNFQQSNYVFK